MMSTKEQIEWQKQAYGTTIEEMENQFESELVDDPAFYAICILSDAQEVLEHNPETARQFINKAKYFMAKCKKLRQ